MITARANHDRVPSSQDVLLSESQDNSIDILFQKVVFYLNPFLGAEKVAKLEASLCSHGAIKTTASVATRGASVTTHIITDDFDFPDYKHAKARGIHIVKPDWVYRSIALNSLQDPSRFSVDPYNIFSGIVMTTTGLPAYDRKLVCDAVERFGGSYANGVTEGLTHLIALAATGDKYDYIMAHPELKIKVVLPTWFQLCCNMGCLFPETVYEFPDPPMQNPSFDPSQLEVASLSAPQLYSNSVKSVAAFLNSPSQGQSMFLEGLRFVLAEDITMLPDLRTKFLEKIEHAGGTVLGNAKDYSKEDVDVVICRFRAGHLYTKASIDGKTVATVDWLLRVLQTGRISSPKASLLHYPIPNQPITGMSSLIITVSNYTGSIREYLKRLIQATGATYKPNLTSQASPDPTTHIICGNASGEKYEKGHEWNVKVVNHLWIEDCFQRWSMQSETQSRYTMFPPYNQLSLVFGSKISPESAEDWYLLSAEDDEDIALVKQEEVEGGVKDIIKRNDTHSKRSQSPHPKAKVAQTPAVAQSSSKSSVPVCPPSPTLTHSALKHEGVARVQSQTSHLPNASTSSSPSTLISSAVASTTDTFASPPPTALSSPAKTTPVSKKSKVPSSSESILPAEGTPAPRSRMRGAAMAAATALKNLVPDMNNFQEELQNEKKASKKKKKAAVVEDAMEEESSDMDVDTESSKAAVGLSSPSKRKRVNVAAPKERSTSVESDDDENSTINSSRDETTSTSKGPVKKVRRTTKSDKDREIAAPPEAMEIVVSTQSGKKDTKQAIRYITTGLPKEPSTKQLKVLKALGISSTTSIDRSTHLVAKGIARTEKFLVALAQGKVIVHEDWLQACVDANSILDENEYRIRDAENEEKIGMDLYKSLKIAREKRVFEGHVFYISPSVVPKPAALKTLVEAGGGRTSALLHTGLNFLKETIQKQKEREAQAESEARRPKGRDSNKSKGAAKNSGADMDEDDSEDEDEVKETIAVISCDDDRDMWGPILEAKAHIYSHELIIQGILRQNVDLGRTHALA